MALANKKVSELIDGEAAQATDLLLVSRGDQSLKIPVSSFGVGNVTGPALSVTGNLAFFLDTTGQLIADAGVGIADGNITFSIDDPAVFGGDTDGLLTLSAGVSAILGGAIRLYGDTHATKADDIELVASNVVQLHYDDSGSLWDFQGNAIQSDSIVVGTPTDDNKGPGTLNAEAVFVDGVAVATVSAGSDITGKVIIWPTDTIPTGYLLCDGGVLQTATSPDLFAVLGYAFGGIGANFNLPDYRGQFLRGVTGGSASDPDAATRQARGDGTGGNVFGTFQADEIRVHTHPEFAAGNFVGESGSGAEEIAVTAGAKIVGRPTATGQQATNGLDTRPKNIYVNFIIKT